MKNIYLATKILIILNNSIRYNSNYYDFIDIIYNNYDSQLYSYANIIFIIGPISSLFIWQICKTLYTLRFI